MAYRNIKTNKGSQTPGVDKTTMKDVAKLTPDKVVEKVRFITVESVHGYRPKPVRYMKGSGEPIYPIGYVKPKPPISKSERVCSYTIEGRKGLHDSLKLDKKLLIEMMNHSNNNQSIEFNDNRLSLFSAQMGKCSVTQRVFRTTEEIHCHHKKPKEKGGGDEYANLTLVLEPVHKLIHAKTDKTINKYLEIAKLTPFEIEKVNKLREMAGNDKIVV